MPAPDVVVKVGDTAEALVYTFRDANGDLEDLTGCTVFFTMRNLTTRVNKVSAVPMTILPPGALANYSCQAQYAWQNADIDTPDLYDCNFTVIREDSTQATW